MYCPLISNGLDHENTYFLRCSVPVIHNAAIELYLFFIIRYRNCNAFSRTATLLFLFIHLMICIMAAERDRIGLHTAMKLIIFNRVKIRQLSKHIVSQVACVVQRCTAPFSNCSKHFALLSSIHTISLNQCGP